MSDETSKNGSWNVAFLMASQACFSATSMTFIAFAGLAGALIAPDRSLATLPISLSMVVVALSTAPLSVLMQKYSRKLVFLACAILGIAGALVAAVGVYYQNFMVFCLATLFIGPYQASAAYYRFAAGESVSVSRAPRAISLVLIGGIFAALFTPMGNSFFNDLFLPHTFMGAFIFSAVVAGVALLPLLAIRQVADTVLDDGGNTTDEQLPPRPLAEVVRQPSFATAVVNGALGYSMMTFVMTATPIAMVEFCGFSSTTSTQVISAHVIAMFLPGLFTGNLIMRFGVLPILLTGHLLFVVAFITALSGIQLANFSVALIALGVGWNFCFVGGTTLLTQLHRPSEKGRVQGLNEMLVFGATALASLAAGVILRYFGWAIVNQAAFVMLAMAAGVTMYWGVRYKTKPVAAS